MRYDPRPGSLLLHPDYLLNAGSEGLPKAGCKLFGFRPGVGVGLLKSRAAKPSTLSLPYGDLSAASGYLGKEALKKKPYKP